MSVSMYRYTSDVRGSYLKRFLLIGKESDEQRDWSRGKGVLRVKPVKWLIILVESDNKEIAPV